MQRPQTINDIPEAQYAGEEIYDFDAPDLELNLDKADVPGTVQHVAVCLGKDVQDVVKARQAVMSQQAPTGETIGDFLRRSSARTETSVLTLVERDDTLKPLLNPEMLSRIPHQLIARGFESTRMRMNPEMGQRLVRLGISAACMNHAPPMQAVFGRDAMLYGTAQVRSRTQLILGQTVTSLIMATSDHRVRRLDANESEAGIGVLYNGFESLEVHPSMSDAVVLTLRGAFTHQELHQMIQSLGIEGAYGITLITDGAEESSVETRAFYRLPEQQLEIGQFVHEQDYNFVLHTEGVFAGQGIRSSQDTYAKNIHMHGSSGHLVAVNTGKGECFVVVTPAWHENHMRFAHPYVV